MDDLWKLGIADVSRAYTSGVTVPVKLTRDLLERITRIDPSLNAFAALSPEAGRDAAESAGPLRLGRARTPREGVPIAVKDNLRVRGCPPHGAARYSRALRARRTRSRSRGSGRRR